MAFKDNPIVDAAAVRSSESVLFVKSQFSEANKFISREEGKDYGVDLNIELINEIGEASSKIFPVQIKSAAELKTIRIDDKEYLSLPFKTSRLGYLMRREPVFGLIILYDDATKACYYDHVDNIVKQIFLEYENNDWKDQAEINIHVPKINLLRNDLTEIHKRFSARFDNLSLCLTQYGPSFNLPTLSTLENPNALDLANPAAIVTFLTENGSYLFNIHEYTMIVDLLSRLTMPAINGNKQLVLLGILTYGQSGNIVESEYYLNKAKLYNSEYTKEQLELIDSTRTRIQFLKGDIDIDELQKRTIANRDKSTNLLNKLNFEISILYTEILRNLRKEEIEEAKMIGLINELTNKITSSTLPKHDQNLLLLFNYENLFAYCSSLMARDAGIFILQQKMGVHVPLQTRINKVNKYINLIEVPKDATYSIYKESVKENDKIVTAYSAYYLARYFFHLEFTNMTMTIEEKHTPSAKAKEHFTGYVTTALLSYNYFAELSMMKDAHLALTCARDLQIIYHLLFNEELITGKLPETENVLSSLEIQLNYPSTPSIAQVAFDDLKQHLEKQSDSFIQDIPDGQELPFAKMVAQAYNLPSTAIPNILHDIHVHKIFEKECKNKNIMLLQKKFPGDTPGTQYKSLPVFVLYHKQLKVETRPNSDIYELLKQFSTILNS